jgi:hypothetical protein
MSAALRFQQVFRGVLARQVEYSYSDRADLVTTMIPLRTNQLRDVIALAEEIPFAGEWSWAIERFAAAVEPDELLFRLDWEREALSGVTLYCRFPSEPGAAGFQQAMRVARPFTWNGPDPSSVAESLGVAGPRGVAFRTTSAGRLRTAVYFRSDEHAGPRWIERLPGLLAACGFADRLASTIETDLKALYNPGPVGVIGVDDGQSGVAGALKFDPSNVSLRAALAFLARTGVAAARLVDLQRIAVGLRADAVTYVGVQYGPDGYGGFRLYFACEPGAARVPGRITVSRPRHLRPVRRLPHY